MRKEAPPPSDSGAVSAKRSALACAGDSLETRSTTRVLEPMGMVAGSAERS